jgi:hypothetical protein
MEKVRDWSMSKEGQNRSASPHSIATERIQNVKAGGELDLRRPLWSQDAQLLF